MYILRNEKNKSSSLSVPLEQPGVNVTYHTLEHIVDATNDPSPTASGNIRLPIVDGEPGKLLLAPNANYHITGDWVFGSGVGPSYQYAGSFSYSVSVAANGVATLLTSFKYNETFSAMDLSIVQNTSVGRPEVVIRTFVWGGMVTRALVHLKVLEITRNAQL